MSPPLGVGMGALGGAAGLGVLRRRSRPVPRIATYAERVLATSPLAYWSLNQSSGLEATDLSGNGYHAKLIGGLWDAGAGPGGGYALREDGVNDSVDLFIRADGSANGLAAVMSTSDVKILVWDRVRGEPVWTDTSTSYRVWDLQGSGERLQAYKQNVVNTVRWSADTGGSFSYVDPEAPVDWVSRGLIYQADGTRKYVWRGEVVGSATIAGTPASAWTQFRLGSLTNGTFPWDGWLRDVIVCGPDTDEAAFLALGVR